MWWRSTCFDKGISPIAARKTHLREIKEIFAIKNAIAEKQIAQQEIDKLMNSVRC